MTAALTAMDTVADLLALVGDVPAYRVRLRPAPGTATVQDVIDVHDRDGRLYELVEGVLVEKPMGYSESRLAIHLASLLHAFVVARNLGIATGADGAVRLGVRLVRIPDVAFIAWDRLPGRRGPAERVPQVAPHLAVEVLSDSNTPAEMAAKRDDYFAAGADLVWEVDPDTRTVDVYTSPSQVATLTAADTLDGAPALPGFTLAVADLFAELDRRG